MGIPALLRTTFGIEPRGLKNVGIAVPNVVGQGAGREPEPDGLLLSGIEDVSGPVPPPPLGNDSIADGTWMIPLGCDATGVRSLGGSLVLRVEFAIMSPPPLNEGAVEKGFGRLPLVRRCF